MNADFECKKTSYIQVIMKAWGKIFENKLPKTNFNDRLSAENSKIIALCEVAVR